MAASAHITVSLQGAKPGSVTNAEADKGGCAPAGFGVKKEPRYKHLAPMGPKDKHVLSPSQVESADLKFEDNGH